MGEWANLLPLFEGKQMDNLIQVYGENPTNLNAETVKKLYKLSSTVDGSEKYPLIKLLLNPDIASGTLYGVNGFQGAEILVEDDGRTRKHLIRYTYNRDGSADSNGRACFTPDTDTQQCYAFVPLTPYNKSVIISVLGDYAIFSPDAEDSASKELLDEAKVLKDTKILHSKVAVELATAEVYSRYAVEIDGLKSKLGDGFKLAKEYKDVIAPIIEQRTAEIFAREKESILEHIELSEAEVTAKPRARARAVKVEE